MSIKSVFYTYHMSVCIYMSIYIVMYSCIKIFLCLWSQEISMIAVFGNAVWMSYYLYVSIIYKKKNVTKKNKQTFSIKLSQNRKVDIINVSFLENKLLFVFVYLYSYGLIILWQFHILFQKNLWVYLNDFNFIYLSISIILKTA